MTAPARKTISAEIDAGFVPRTYRSTTALALAGALFAWRFGAPEAAGPLLAGAVLGLVMFWGTQTTVGAMVRSLGNGTNNREKMRAFLLISVIKYGLVLAVLWLATRTLGTSALIAVGAGVFLVPTNIALRAISRLIVGGAPVSR